MSIRLDALVLKILSSNKMHGHQIIDLHYRAGGAVFNGQHAVAALALVQRLKYVGKGLVKADLRALKQLFGGAGAKSGKAPRSPARIRDALRHSRLRPRSKALPFAPFPCARKSPP